MRIIVSYVTVVYRDPIVHGSLVLILCAKTIGYLRSSIKVVDALRYPQFTLVSHNDTWKRPIKPFTHTTSRKGIGAYGEIF